MTDCLFQLALDLLADSREQGVNVFGAVTIPDHLAQLPAPAPAISAELKFDCCHAGSFQGACPYGMYSAVNDSESK